jgi:hypothetical protein
MIMHYLPRLFAYVGQETAFTKWQIEQGQTTDKHRRTVAQGWGADHIATAAAVAYLNDCGKCATAATVSKLAGHSASTASGKLRRLSESYGMLDATVGVGVGLLGVDCACPSVRTKHYHVSV